MTIDANMSLGIVMVGSRSLFVVVVSILLGENIERNGAHRERQISLHRCLSDDYFASPGHNH